MNKSTLKQPVAHVEQAQEAMTLVANEPVANVQAAAFKVWLLGAQRDALFDMNNSTGEDFRRHLDDFMQFTTAYQVFEIVSLLKLVRKVADKIKSNINDLEDQIDELGLRRKVLVNTPLSKADTLSILRLDIQGKARSFENSLRKKVKGLNVTQLAKAKAQADGLLISFADAEGINKSQVSIGALHFYFEDQIMAGAERALEHEVWPTNTRPLAEIEAEIQDIDQKVNALTAQRDLIANDLIATGVTE